MNRVEARSYAGTLLVLKHDEVRQMYFQNPRFGFFFLERVAERLSREARRVAGEGGQAEPRKDKLVLLDSAV